MLSIKFNQENAELITNLVNDCKLTGERHCELLPNNSFVQVSRYYLSDFLGSREVIQIICIKDNKQVACLYEEV